MHTVDVGSKGSPARKVVSPRSTSLKVRGLRRMNHTPEGYATTPTLRFFLGISNLFAKLIRHITGAVRRGKTAV